MNNFTKPFIIEFLGMPGAGKTTCSAAVIEKYPFLLYFTTEEIPSSKEESPFSFNKKAINLLTQNVKHAEHGACLLLDRGVEDLKIWIQIHHELNNLGSIENFTTMLRSIPKIPDKIPYHKFVFPHSMSKCNTEVES